MKIADIIVKLISRKLWMAIASFVSGLYIAFGGSTSQGVQIAGLIMAGATVIGYAFAQGLVDAQAANTTGTQIALTQPPSTPTATPAASTDTAPYTGNTPAL